MITLKDIQPASATPEPNRPDVNNEWDGTSINKDDGQEQKNLDSRMEWPDHQEIVLAAGALLVNMPASAAKQDQASASLARLKKAYEGSGELLRVTKGIHQPNHNPHIQLGLWSKDGTERVGTYHLNVYPTDTQLKDDYFQWKPVQFVGYGDTPKGDGSLRNWPKDAGFRLKRDSSRRHSISSVDLQLRVDKYNESVAAQNKKAEDKLADDQANPGKVVQRNDDAMRSRLTKSHIVLVSHPPGAIKRFLAGEEVSLTYTKGGKGPPIKVTGTFDGKTKFLYEASGKSSSIEISK